MGCDVDSEVFNLTSSKSDPTLIEINSKTATFQTYDTNTDTQNIDHEDKNIINKNITSNKMSSSSIESFHEVDTPIDNNTNIDLQIDTTDGEKEQNVEVDRDPPIEGGQNVIVAEKEPEKDLESAPQNETFVPTETEAPKPATEAESKPKPVEPEPAKLEQKKPAPPTVAENDSNEQDNHHHDVGSINNRLNQYQTKATSETKVLSSEPVPAKISSIDKYKQNYMKKADTTSISTTPSETAPTPPGTMSLRERMKMFESQDKSSRVPAREIVSQGERASDIRNKINLWGQSNATPSYQREKITVGSISERKNLYANWAN